MDINIYSSNGSEQAKILRSLRLTSLSALWCLFESSGNQSKRRDDESSGFVANNKSNQNIRGHVNPGARHHNNALRAHFFNDRNYPQIWFPSLFVLIFIYLLSLFYQLSKFIIFRFLESKNIKM